MSLIPPIKYAAEFKEQQHPRDQGGQFTSGGGGGGAQEEKKSSTSTPEFRGEWSDYTKTTAENVYGEVVDKFPSLRTTFQGLQTEGAGKYGGEAGFDAFGHTIRLDASSAKQSETQELDRQFDRAAKTVGAIEAGYRGWLIHEFGHAIDHSIINGIAESEKDEYFEAKKSLVDRLDAPSEYGSTSRGEWVAERFLLESTGGAEPTLTEFLSEWSERAEGKPATDKPTSTPEFKAWFGDSKVVDESGEPLVTYHGTDAAFERFNPELATTSTGHPLASVGIFFIEHPAGADLFNKDIPDVPFPDIAKAPMRRGAATMPVYLAIKNPYEITADFFRNELPVHRTYNEVGGFSKTKEQIVAWRDELISQGYDGIKITQDPNRQYKGDEWGWNNWVAFNPTQIKSSIGNQGSFDPDDPRINYSKWNEPDHPRDDDGKFGSKGGGKAVDDDDEWEARQREKTEKRAAASEAAVQRRQPIRDAFRSVKSLGGGHNLSTIEGWRSYITASFNALDKAFPGVFTHNQIAKLHQQDEMSYKGRKFKFGTNLDREDYLQAVIEDKAPDLLESSPTKSNPIKAAGFTPDSRQKWRKNNRVAQRQTQTPQVGSAAAKLNSGGVSQDEYLATVKEHRPIKPLTEVPEIPTFKEIVGALDESKLARGIVGLTPVKTPDGSGELKDGDKVAARLDIPAYDHYDTWVVSLHDGSKKGGGSIGYAQTSVLDNVEFVSSPRAALNIGMGKKDKQPFARMHGDWKTHSPQDARARAVTYMDHPDWKQVGMNPFRHSWFYDKDDGKPIVGAEQVIQIGALVLAKNVKYAPVDDDRFAFTNEKGETSHYAKWEESKHPRDESGRFRSGGGGADKPKKQNALEMIEQILSGGKPKMQTAEEKEVEEKEKATNEVLKNEGFEDTEDTVDYWLDPDHAEDFYDLDLDQRVALVRASYSDDNSGDDQLLGFDISREFIAKDDTLYGIAKDLLDDGRDLNGAEYEPGQPMGIEYEDELGHYEPPSEPDLTEYLMNKYPEGHNWDEAGFLTNDGRLASMGQYGSRGEDHRSALPTEEAMERWGWSKESRDNRTVALWEMGIRSGHIRVHVAGGDMSLEVYGPLTSDQKIALGDFFRDVGPSSVAIDVTGKTGPVAGSMLDYPSVAELDAYIDSALEEKGDYYSRRQPVQRYTKFDESKHPRDESGKFGEGGGGADEPPFQLEQQKKKTGRPPKMFTPQEKEQMVLFRGKDELPGQTDWIEQQEERERASSQPPTASPEFKNWFGNSKVVNDDGSPKVIYHGTTAAFDEFSPFGQVASGLEMGAGTYLTSDPTKAGAYATGEGGNIMPVFLKAENIFDVTGTITPEQQARISARLSSDILPQDLSYQQSTRHSARFSEHDKEKAWDLYDERSDHWDKHGDGYDRFKPTTSRDGTDWLVEYSDPDDVGVSANGKTAFSQLMNTYGSDYTRVLAEIGIDAVQSGSTYVVTSPTQIKSATGNQGSFDPKDPRINYAKFDESKHPRADDGKFGEGGGGGNERDNILDALEGHGFDRRDFDDPQENTLESLQELLDYETEQAGGEREAGAAAAESEEADHKAWKAREEGVSRVADAALSTAEAGGWSAPKGIYTAKSSSSRYVELQREGEYGAEYLNVRISDHVAPMGAGFNPESQEYNEPPDVDIIVGDDGTADLSVLQERVGGGTSKPKKSSPTSSPEFKNWFGGSKIVDKQGEPLVMYHGTTGEDFTSFDISKSGETSGQKLVEGGKSDATMGFFFTNNPKEAENWTYKSGEIVGHIKPVYLNVRNPLVVHDPHKGYTDRKFQADAIQRAIQGGYDGLIIKDTLGQTQSEANRGDSIVVFSPTQIKSSIGNQGSFDPDDPRITYSKWEESDHPRDDDGKFGSGGGGGAQPEDKSSTGQDKFMEDFNEMGHPHPLSGGRVFYLRDRDSGETAHIQLEIHRNEDYVTIDEISVQEGQTGKGFGSAIMSQVVAKADEHGVKLGLFAVPLGIHGQQKMPEKKLREFYEGFGFKQDGVQWMVREPQGGETEEKKSPTSSPEFKHWFGDSKVVDEQGEPLVVYHGTDKDFDAFKKTKGVHRVLFSTFEVDREGFYFTPDSEVANSFGENVIPSYLSIQNPADIFSESTATSRASWEKIRGDLIGRGFNERWLDKTDSWEMFDEEDGKEFVDALRSMGYDGAIIEEPSVEGEREQSISYIAFEPTQIKSATDNTGSFDPEDPRINYSMLTEEGHKASLYEEKIAQYAAKREQKEWYGRAWEEAQHQRDESGQFASGSGSSALQQARGDAGRPTEAGVVHTGTQVPEREQTWIQKAQQRYPKAKPMQFDPGGSIYYEPVRKHEYTGAPLAHGDAPLWLLSPEITTVEMELAGGRTSAIERRKNMGHPPTFNEMGMPVFDAQMHPSAIRSGSGSLFRSPAGYSRLAGMFHAEYYARQMTLWNEPDHPRDKDGQFASGSGQEKKPEEEKKPKPKPEPEPEPETTEVKFKVRGHGEWVWDGTEKQHGIRKDRLITQVGTGQKAWLMLYDGGYRIAKPNDEGERPGFWDARKNTIAKGKKNPLDAAIKEGSRTKERAGRFTDVEGGLARMVLVGMFDLSLQKMMQQANSVPEANRAQATYDRMSEILPRVVSKLGTKAARLAGKLESITIYRDVHQLREGRGTSSGVLGYYRYSAHSDDSGELHLTAEGIPEGDQEDVVAHEFCHAVDGPRNVYSDNPEWKRVWKKEIGSRRAMHAVWGGGKEGWCKGTKVGDVKAGDRIRDGREWKTVAKAEAGFVGRKKTMRIKWEGEQDFEHYKRLAYVMVEGNEPLPEPPLTAYAQLKASEGFAEFGAQVVRDADGAKENFPACYALWEKWGLVE